MAVLAIGALGAAAGGIGGMLSGNKAAKAQKKHQKWLQGQLLETKAANKSLFAEARGEQRLGLLGLLKSQKNRQKLFGDLGAGAAETINRSTDQQLADVNQQAAQAGVSSRFLGARTGVMRNGALALNQLKAQLAGMGIGMQGDFGHELAMQHGAMAGVAQNEAGANSQLFGSGGALMADAAPTGYSPQGDFLAALGQGVSFFAGMQALNKQQGQQWVGQENGVF